MAADKWSRWLKEERWPGEPGVLQAFLNSVRDRILELANLRAGERVVNLGSGTGLLGLRAAEIVGPSGVVVCLDLSADALRTAAPLASTGRELFVAADALSCPLPDAWADAVVTRSVLIYIPDRRAAAMEIARILGPGGRAVVCEPINRRMQPIVDMTAFEDVEAAYRASMDTCPLTSFDENDFVSCFREAGFASAEMRMSESRWPVRGKEWAHSFRHGAPSGYSAYDMLLAGGITPQRADEFIAAGEQQLGDRWTTMSCPVAYLIARRRL